MVIKYRSNLCAGIFSIIAGITLWLIIPLQIAEDYVKSYGITSRTIPYGVALLFIACGVSLGFQSLVLKKDTVKEIHVNSELRAFTYIAALLLYSIIFKYSFIAALIFIGTMTLIFTKTRKYLYYGIIVAVTLALYFIFKFGLNVRLRY